MEASAGKEIVDLMDALPCPVMLKNGTSRETETWVVNTVKVLKSLLLYALWLRQLQDRQTIK